jgi:hypothetical protein
MPPDRMPRRVTQCHIDRHQKTFGGWQTGSGYNFGLKQAIDAIQRLCPSFRYRPIEYRIQLQRPTTRSFSNCVYFRFYSHHLSSRTSVDITMCGCTRNSIGQHRGVQSLESYLCVQEIRGSDIYTSPIHHLGFWPRDYVRRPRLHRRSTSRPQKHKRTARSRLYHVPRR